MSYYITFINREDGSEWAVLETCEYGYALSVFKDLSAPPEFDMELRETEENVDIHLNYRVLRSA